MSKKLISPDCDCCCSCHACPPCKHCVEHVVLEEDFSEEEICDLLEDGWNWEEE